MGTEPAAAPGAAGAPGAPAGGAPYPYQQPYPQQQYQQPYPSAYPQPYPTSYAGAAMPPGKKTTTPDGQPLAGLGARLVARIVDGFVVAVVGVLAGLPLWIDAFRSMFDWIEANQTAFETGTVNPFALYTESGALGPLIGAQLVLYIVQAIYTIGLVGWRGATLGKLIMGIQVRDWNTPGVPTWGQATKRWVTGELVGALVGLYSLIDALFPLWDDRKQALHDKWPGTVVVRRAPRG